MGISSFEQPNCAITIITIEKNNIEFENIKKNIDFNNIMIMTIIRNPYERIMSDLFFLQKITICFLFRIKEIKTTVKIKNK